MAIENARLYESATRWSRQLESLIEVGNALSGEIELPRVLQLVTDKVRELIDARERLHRVARVRTALDPGRGRGAAEQFVGTELPSSAKSVRVLERRRSERVDSLIDDPEVDQEFTRQLGAYDGPLRAADRSRPADRDRDGARQGARPRFTDEDLRLAETFAERAAVAVDLSTRVARDALRRVVDAQELERKRLARELHDETGQALTSMLLGLRAIEEAKTRTSVAEATARLREQLVDTLHDVRRLAVELGRRRSTTSGSCLRSSA